MSEMIKSGVLGLITILFWMLDAHFTNESEQTDIKNP